MGNIKKRVIGLAVGIFTISVLGPANVNAATPGHTDVTGVVTHQHMALANASVNVLCNGQTLTDMTDSHGSYLVSFLATDCPFGSTVKVTGQKDGMSGVSSGTVRGVTTKLNLAIVNVEVPEYGLVGGLAASGAGLGMIAYLRRRQQLAL